MFYTTYKRVKENDEIRHLPPIRKSRPAFKLRWTALIIIQILLGPYRFSVLQSSIFTGLFNEDLIRKGLSRQNCIFGGFSLGEKPAILSSPKAFALRVPILLE